MQPPRIEYINPTSRSLGRMTTILFRPFDFGKWFVLGFTAWLATLLESGGGRVQTNTSSEDGGILVDRTGEVFEKSRDFVLENLEWIVPVAIAAVLLLLAVWVVLVWLSSRGKFMFLDNVVHNRALVKAPWREFKDVGNSLFRWRLVFSLIMISIASAMLAIVAFLVFSRMGVNPLVDRNPEEWDVSAPEDFLIIILSAAVVGVVLALAIAYIVMLLEDFVIPIMYKHGIPATGAWRLVIDLHSRQFGYFILYFLWKILLWIGAILTIFAVMIATCCVAACLMAIPYLGAVFLLPVTVFFRALGPEFLRQFGGDCDLWEGSPDPFGFEPPDPAPRFPSDPYG